MSAGPHRPADSPERIVLTGFMGAGKSTVGRILAARLGWRFFDIDTVIATEQHLSIAEIFRLHGEGHFRELEAKAVRKTVSQAECVIALGGGAIETPEVRTLLFPQTRQPSLSSAVTLTIFLEAPLSELLARCSAHPDHHVRPLLSAAEPVEARLHRRLPHYQRAHLTIETSGRSPDAVIDHILERVPALQIMADARRRARTHSASNTGAAS